MNLRSILTRPSKPAQPAFQYGMLAFLLLLLALDIWWRLHLPPTWSPGHYMDGVLILMLLFNHLAYQFKWPLSVTVALRVLAWSWILFGLFYISIVIGRTFFVSSTHLGD